MSRDLDIDLDSTMARLAELDEIIAKDKAERLMAVTQQLAEMGNGSLLFGALRQAYAEADPAFKARMEAMT